MNIGIVGLGLIGGSLGFEFRAHGHHVLGVSRKGETCITAQEKGVVDRADTDLALMQDADVVFLCTPLGAIPTTTTSLIPHLKPDTVLTDVGSVKQWVVEYLSPRWPNFIGGHPMAGTADSGIEAAQTDLFTGAAYVLTPTETTPPIALETVEALIQPLQTRIYHCSPEDHDRAVAWISHLPVMISASLIGACMSEPEARVLQLAIDLASSGFRDTSRVGGGNPDLGPMMAQYNRPALLTALHSYRQQLDQVIACVEQENWPALTAYLQTTHQARPRFVARPPDR